MDEQKTREWARNMMAVDIEDWDGLRHVARQYLWSLARKPYDRVSEIVVEEALRIYPFRKPTEKEIEEATRLITVRDKIDERASREHQYFVRAANEDANNDHWKFTRLCNETGNRDIARRKFVAQRMQETYGNVSPTANRSEISARLSEIVESLIREEDR
jgi:hypothetical protein